LEMSARAVAGGSPFNVAIGLARLGIRTAFLGGISRDPFGAFLADTLSREGVEDGFLVRTDRLSTISIVATTDDGQPNYAFHGEGAADRSLRLAHLPSVLPDDIQALTFGSYSMAVEPVGTTFAALAQREHGRLVISVDPNVRPTVVSDMQSWAAAAERFYRMATVIKASDEDVRIAWGGRLSIADAAAYWLTCGARLVAVTEGVRGQPPLLPLAAFQCPAVPWSCATLWAPETHSTPRCLPSWQKPAGSILRPSRHSNYQRSASSSLTQPLPPPSRFPAMVPTCRPPPTSKGVCSHV
jgi:fructokinase